VGPALDRGPESFHIGARLNRGRSYARQGQVLDIQIVRARSGQGAGFPAPALSSQYQLKPLSAADWRN